MSNNRQIGPWIINKPLGHGKDGKCYTVRRAENDKLFTLKTPRKSTSDLKKEKLKKEVAALKKLDHPNVLKLIDYNLNGDPYYMVTEYCKNGTLYNTKIRHWDLGKKMRCFDLVCKGFQHIHEKGIAVSGLHFGNIFLKENDIPVIGDFGCCYTSEFASKETIRYAQALTMRYIGFLYHGLMVGKAEKRKLIQAIADTGYEKNRWKQVGEMNQINL